MKTLRFSILAALVLSAGIFAHAADWPAYRGPDGDGISSETLPKKVVPSQPVWMVETPTPLTRVHPMPGCPTAAPQRDASASASSAW